MSLAIYLFPCLPDRAIPAMPQHNSSQPGVRISSGKITQGTHIAQICKNFL